MKLESKVLEIRDKGTCICAIAIRMMSSVDDPTGVQNWAIHAHSGYPRDGSGIVLMRLADQKASVDPYAWEEGRTMGNAHNFIYENFDSLKDGDVVDVRVILGEAKEPAKSDRFYKHQT